MTTIETTPEQLRRVTRERDALLAACWDMVRMIRIHRELYGYEKQHYIIDDGPQWQALEAAIALCEGKEQP